MKNVFFILGLLFGITARAEEARARSNASAARIRLGVIDAGDDG